jgi:hypothetical protein
MTAPHEGLNHAANAGRHRLAERRGDLYETPASAVHALLRAEPLPHRVWEPACGPGAIVAVLRAAGHEVAATDLNEWGCPHSTSRVDFLLERRAPDGVEAIVTNPPFSLANEFVAHALDLAPRVVMLLRLQFLEGVGRAELLERRGLARVYVFRDRLPMMHRHGWAGPRASSSIAYAWFVWDRAHQGHASFHRLTARVRP